MSVLNRLVFAVSFSLFSLSASAGLPPPPTPVDAPPTLSLMALGLVGAVLFARYLKR